jgi:hypothetical protein
LLTSYIAYTRKEKRKGRNVNEFTKIRTEKSVYLILAGDFNA